jgi:hypothetical protein
MSPEAPIALGARRELFVDHLLVDRMDGAQLRLHSPRPAGTAIAVDKPWEGHFNCAHTLHRVGDRWHLYYRGLTKEEWDKEHTCVAFSDDGITWTKPELGLVETCGTRANNCITAEDEGPTRLFVFTDDGPGVPDDERIKALRIVADTGYITPTNAGKGAKGPVFFVSADGLSFRLHDRQPKLRCSWRNAFDAQTIFFWSEVEQCYCCYFRYMVDGLRTMARTTSPDLVEWAEPVKMTYSDTGDIKPAHEFYLHNTRPYFRAPHIYLSMPPRFMKGRQALSEAEAAALDIGTLHDPKSGITHVYHQDCSDTCFMSTRAGSTRYDRTFPEAWVRPGLGPENWCSRSNYVYDGMIQTGPAELSVYVGRHYPLGSWHLERLALRVDGFGSLYAGHGGGELLTKPLTFEGGRLELNVSTSAAGGVKVELQQPDGAPIDGFALGDCDEVIGDAIDRIVTWRGSGDVSSVAGQPVRVRFALNDADVFSFRFGE